MALMDGAWTGHPDQNQIAVASSLSRTNCQRAAQMPTRILTCDLSPRALETHPAGTRAAVRTVIRYRKGVLSGRGASLLDGYMEDLATDRIYRLMIAQRMQHRDKSTFSTTSAPLCPTLLTSSPTFSTKNWRESCMNCHRVRHPK